MFDQITDVRREKFDQNMGEHWASMNRHLKSFFRELTADDPRGELEDLGTISVDDGDIYPLVTFKGLGLVSQARPRIFKEGRDWKVQIMFHRIMTSIIGEKSSEPLYCVEIDWDGDVSFGNGSVEIGLYPQGAPRRGRIKRRVLKDLLCIAEDSA